MKFLFLKLNQAIKRIEEIILEKAVMKSCITDVNVLLSDITETRDSLTTITFRKHLAEKHRPIFVILNGLEGVLEFFVTPK